jgi:hypothetical protein
MNMNEIILLNMLTKTIFIRKREREKTIELYKQLKYKLRNYFNRASKEYLLNT